MILCKVSVVYIGFKVLLGRSFLDFLNLLCESMLQSWTKPVEKNEVFSDNFVTTDTSTPFHSLKFLIDEQSTYQGRGCVVSSR